MSLPAFPFPSNHVYLDKGRWIVRDGGFRTRIRMKQIELTREVKKELWRLFDAGHVLQGMSINGQRIDPEALEKQRRLWQAYRSRNPKRGKTNAIQAERTAAG